ncbi:MAG TPA: hypothetical protein VLJ41_01500 [Segetibacter sp.]|nr:hypothetical protein [Segetibacter sp.]
MLEKEQDPNLQAPQAANTTKHINFLEAEENDAVNLNNTNNNDSDESQSKKAWEELRKDKRTEQGSSS